MTIEFPRLGESRVDAVLARLYADTLRTDASLREAAHRQGMDEQHPGFYRAMQQAYMPVTPEFGKLLHLLVRSARVCTVVEYGTSFGISTLFLAAALRARGGGRLISCELETGKAARAQSNLSEAGLSDLVEIRVGDALQTLGRDLPDPIGLVLLDGAKSTYLDVLHLLEPQLAPGCVIASDNSEMASAQPYLDHVRDPARGYLCASVSTFALGQRCGHDLVVRC